MNGRWVPHDLRDEVVDFVGLWSEKTEMPAARWVNWIGVARGKFYDWSKRYGLANEHNGKIPRDFWLEDWEREAILAFHDRNPLEGYRSLAFMMLDADIVAVSPSSVYRVLRQAGRLDRWNRKPSSKGQGFQQPEMPHQHWHADIAYVNLASTFYYLTSVLDGCSRYLLHWELRESMTEADVEIVLQRAREQYPGTRPRVITDNGSAFIARDFKIFLREAGMTHVKTSPYYPQSNGKIERWHKTLKSEALRRFQPQDPDHARRIVQTFVDHYNHVRLHSAIGYITPADRLADRQQEIWNERDRKLELAREIRRQRRKEQRRTIGGAA